MSGKILLLRHGETDWKFRGRLQGVAPVPINEHGRNQSKMLADHLVREHEELEGIYASNLRRAQETAQIIHTMFDEEPSFVTEEALQALDWGVWQGMPLGFILNEEPRFDFNENGEDALDIRPKKGESLNELKARIQPYWRKFCTMVAQEDSDYPYVVVTHSQPLNAIMADFADESYYELVKGFDHDPIEVGTVVVDDEGEVQSFEKPNPPWNTI